LSQEELLRLLLLANRFSMLSCVKECAQALRFGTYDEALAFVRAVPEELMEDPRLLGVAIQKAGDVVAAALGSVERLWRPAEVYNPGVSWRRNWLLDERVKTLPFNVMKAVLRSERLQLKSENYSLSLAMWWVAEQQDRTAEERRGFFEGLSNSLRYARMTTAFVVSALHAWSSWYCAIDPLPILLRMWRKGSAAASQPLMDTRAWPASRVRARPTYIMNLTAYFPRAAIEALREPGDKARAPLDLLLHGYPVYLSMMREEDDAYSLVLSSHFLMWDDGPRPRHPWDDDDNHRGFAFNLIMCRLGNMAVDHGPQGSPRTTMVGSVHPLLLFGGGVFVYDANDKMQVQLVLSVEQELDC
jgi:hypothetical protein